MNRPIFRALIVLGAAVLTTSSLPAQADTPTEKMKFNYRATELGKVLDDYALVTKQKFVVDAGAHAKITILNSGPVSREEAFEQLSAALAMNGYGFLAEGDELRLMQARNLQRTGIPVVRELPAAKPERMVTWIYQAKFISADEINKQLRILTSRDGELVSFLPTNQILISDWTSNLQRVAAILNEIDHEQKKAK